MNTFIQLFQSWRGGSRQMILDDYLAAFALPVLVVAVGRQEALLFNSPSSLMALLCLVYTCYLIYSKNRWPSEPSRNAIMAVLASVIAVSVTLIPGPRFNAWLTSLLLLLCLCMYRTLLELAWTEFRTSFTPGELLVLAQIMVIITFPTCMEILKYTRVLKYHEVLFAVSETAVAVISRTAVVSAMFVFLASLSQPQNFQTYVIAAILFSSGHVTAVIGEDPVMGLVGFLLKPGRICLISYWLCTVAACLPVLLYYRHYAMTSQSDMTSEQRVPSTVTRKYFHVVIVAIYLPGLYYDVELLHLASGVAMAGLILLETIRLHEITPFGGAVSDLFSSFRDRQDRGRLILTPLYLLGACGAPVWLFGAKIPRGEVAPLVLFLGVMGVGVGDAAASIFGSKFGTNSPKLSDNKSLVGFLAGLISQLAFWLGLIYYGVGGAHCIMPLVILMSSLTETYTAHVDNLVIPLYTLIVYTIMEYGVAYIMDSQSDRIPV